MLQHLPKAGTVIDAISTADGLVVILGNKGEACTASAPDFFTEDTPTAVLVRQVLGAILEKASSVAKLAAARKRKRESEGRGEGRKPLSETRPEVVALARKLRRRKPKGGQLSLRGVASELAARGFLNERGKPYAAKSVARMLGRRSRDVSAYLRET